MNQEFIEKTKKHEGDFINAKIKIQNVEDWNELKTTIFHLGNLYIEGTEDTIFVKHCQEYLRLMWRSIKEVEKKYQNIWTEENIKTIVYQLRVLCLFHSCTSYRQELAESYTLENTQSDKNIPYVDAKDIGEKEYRIKESDYATFQESCKSQKDLYNAYVYAYTYIYGTREEKLKLLMEDYRIDAENLRKEFLEGKIIISNIAQWNLLKDRVNAFRINCEDLHLNLKETENFQVNKNSCENFVNLISDYIHKVEERYNGNISASDLPYLMENLHTICRYDFLNEEKDRIIFVASKTQKKSDIKLSVLTSKGIVMHIEEKAAKQWEQVNQEQKALEEKYQSAYEFAFGKNSNEGKRAI